MRVAIMSTCLVDAVTPDVGKALVKLLRQLGVSVDVPSQQTCCGQMHTNSGYPDLAMPLVRNFVATFEGFDAVVVPSGSCTGSVRHQHSLVATMNNDDELAQRARALAARTYELSEFIVDLLGIVDVGAYFPHVVTYHPTCHSLRVVGVRDRPLDLLRHVAGLRLVELPDAESCCGFGGTFALKNSAVSTAMLADKVAAIAQTNATVCAVGDTSCLLHINGGLTRMCGNRARTIHLAEILASSRR